MAKMDFCNSLIRSTFFLFCYFDAYLILSANAKPEPQISNANEALFLTPYLEKGEIDKAKQLAEVQPIMGECKSYAGFLTVNKDFDSNHFIWFFPAIKGPETAPVVVWLTGGPCSSTVNALFYESGPYGVGLLNNTLYERQFSWTETLSMLYIDSPVGTGFSFTKQNEGYCKTQEDVAANLYTTVVQFFQLFPELLKNEFYVVGGSYGGKFAPSLAFAIHEGNKQSNSEINLKGVAIGNGYADPVNQLRHAQYLNEVGLIDDNEKIKIEEQEKLLEQLIIDGKTDEALGVQATITKEISEFSGFQDFWNYLYSSPTYVPSIYARFVQQDSIRQKIHVGNLTFNDGNVCAEFLKGDQYRSVVPWIKVLLESGYKFMAFSGQVDIIIPYHETVNYLQKLDWSGAEEYKTSKRQIWKVSADDGEIAGYVRIVRNLYEVMVRNAGHLVCADQARAGFDLISRFIFSETFF